MPVAIALIFCVVLFAVLLVGIAWALAVLVPFYAYVGLAIYLVWKSSRRQPKWRQRWRATPRDKGLSTIGKCGLGILKKGQFN